MWLWDAMVLSGSHVRDGAVKCVTLLAVACVSYLRMSNVHCDWRLVVSTENHGCRDFRQLPWTVWFLPNAAICRVAVAILHECLIITEYKLQVILQFSTKKKSFGTNLLPLISRALLLPHSAAACACSVTVTSQSLVLRCGVVLFILCPRCSKIVLQGNARCWQ